MKGREPEWSNPKSSTGNCMNCTKMKSKMCTPYEHMTKNFKFLTFEELLKPILRVLISILGGVAKFDFVG